MSETANVSDIHVQCFADSFQHIHPNWLIPGQLPIGGFADPGQVDDVAGTVSAPFQKEPDHVTSPR